MRSGAAIHRGRPPAGRTVRRLVEARWRNDRHRSHCVTWYKTGADFHDELCGAYQHVCTGARPWPRPAFAQAAGDAPSPPLPSRPGRPPTRPNSSPNMRRAPRSTSPARCPASRSISATPTSAASAARPAMSSSTAQRPSSKAESPGTDVLAKSPRGGSSRVEVGPGDLYGADYSSKSQVLNIIMSAEGGIDGNVTGSVRRLYTGCVDP